MTPIGCNLRRIFGFPENNGATLYDTSPVLPFLMEEKALGDSNVIGNAAEPSKDCDSQDLGILDLLSTNLWHASSAWESTT
jgi:hypothetical protein